MRMARSGLSIHMARVGLAALSVAEALRWPHATVVGYMDSLFAADLLPKGTRGRGKGGQYQLSHLTNLMLGFGGPLPADAAEAAMLARSLVHLKTDPVTSGQSFYNLGVVIEKLIDVAARGAVSGELPLTELCFNPLCARLIWTLPNGLEKADVYKPSVQISMDLNASKRLHRGGGVTTIKHLYPKIIDTMGRLWLDTLRYQ